MSVNHLFKKKTHKTPCLHFWLVGPERTTEPTETLPFFFFPISPSPSSSFLVHFKVPLHIHSISSFLLLLLFLQISPPLKKESFGNDKAKKESGKNPSSSLFFPFSILLLCPLPTRSFFSNVRRIGWPRIARTPQFLSIFDP